MSDEDAGHGAVLGVISVLFGVIALWLVVINTRKPGFGGVFAGPAVGLIGLFVGGAGFVKCRTWFAASPSVVGLVMCVLCCLYGLFALFLSSF